MSHCPALRRDRAATHAFAVLALALGACASNLLITGALRADGASPADGTRASAFADTSRPVMFLKETVITGARYPRAYYESPQALSFVSRLQLREQAPTAIGDVLTGLPGVDNSKDSPWEQRPVLRGLSGQRVLVLMDGSPVNSARGNGPHPSLVDPSQVERIEVVRGPSSVAYGSDALGGVINIITREAVFTEPGQIFRGSAALGGSSADHQTNGYLEMMPRIGRLSTFVSSGGRKAGDFQSPGGTVQNSSFSAYNALANLRYDWTRHLALKVGYQLYRGDGIGIPGLSTPTANFGPGNSTAFDFKYYDRDLAHLTLDHNYGSSWIETSRAKVYWQQERRNFFSTERIDSASYAIYGIPSNGSVYRQTDQDRLFDLNTWGGQLQVTSRKTSLYRFTSGLDAARDLTAGDNERRRTSHFATPSGADSAGSTATRITQSVPTGHFDNYGLFAQSEWYVRPQWTLSAGGRYTHYRYRADAFNPTPTASQPAQSSDDDALSGSAGIVYRPVQDLHVSFNAANGYRQPNAQDLYFNGAASVGNVLGNPDLKPERSLSYDLGLRWGPGTLAFSANAFYSTYDDLIDAINVTPAGTPPGAPRTYRYVNISEARIWGAESEVEWRFLPRWSARTALAGAVGDITNAGAIQALYGVTADVAPLPSVPPFKGSFAVRWRDARDRFWVEPSTRFSWRTNRLPLPTPGVAQLTEFKKEWIVADLFAGARTPWGQRLVLGVRNLTDTPYRQSLASLEEPGTNVVGSLSTDF